MRKMIIFALVTLLVISNVPVGADEGTIKVLVDESKRFIYDEEDQEFLIETFDWPEDADFSCSFDNTGEYWGFGNLKEKIEEIASVDVRKEGKLSYSILKNYDVLIIASFVEGYSAAEANAIKRFVESGGGLILLGDGEHANNSVSRKLDVSYHSEYVVISDLAVKQGSSKGFRITDRGVIWSVPKAFYIEIETLIDHPITEGIESFALFYGIPIVSYKSGDVLIQTGANTWADELTIGEEIGVQDRDEDSGPFDVLLAQTVGRGRTVFVGSSLSFWNLITDRQEDNLNLFFNAVKWLGEPGGPYKQYRTVNEQAQQDLSNAVSLYNSHSFSQAKSAFENAIETFEESAEIYPNSEATEGIQTAEEYIPKCETGIEADQIRGSAETLYNDRNYENAITEYEKAKALYQDIAYTERVQECDTKIAESNAFITLRDEATQLFSEGEDALATAPSTFSTTGYEEAKSLFEQSKRKWEDYDDPEKVADCEEKIDLCNDEIAEIERTRMLVIIVVVGIIVVVVVVIVIVKRRKPAVREIPVEEEIPLPEGEEAIEPEKDPLQVLKDRYARGEITKEEYEDLKSVLEKG